MQTGGWDLTVSGGGKLSCTTLVNAAGAWADPVAQMAGVRPLGITPFRRTVAQLRTAPEPSSTLPLVLDIGGQLLFQAGERAPVAQPA